MRIKLGAPVKTNDGHRAGNVSKVVWDPERNEISEFVLTTSGLLGHDVIVSREILERATPSGDELVVDLTKHELEGLEEYDERGYAPPPYGWMLPAESNYEADAFLFPTVSDRAVDEPETNAASARRRPVIRKGMPVKDAAGEKIGKVEELRIDDMTGELRAIVVRPEGAGDERTREIPADQLDVGDDEVHLIEESPAKRAP